MNCKLPSVQISGLALSDLFFNSKVENYAACMAGDGVGQVLALTKDAQEFIDDLGIEDQNIDAAMLATDFFNRL